jgi:tetratricopeptide (TPR) repeat protein
MALGRGKESLAESERALELEPFDHIVNQHLGWHYLYTREYDKALEQLQKTLELKPDLFPTHLIMGMSYTQVGEYAKAIEYYRKAFELEGVQTTLGFLGHALALSGRKDEALKTLRDLLEHSKQNFMVFYHIALIYVGLDEKDQAFEWLEKAFNERNEWMCWLKVAPELDSLRSDERLTNLIQRVGIPS